MIRQYHMIQWLAIILATFSIGLSIFVFIKVIESDQEVPTLLHFAAKHGLEDLCCTIMDTPGSSAAFQIENKDGHDPADLAELNKHVDLAEHMRTHFVSFWLIYWLIGV